MDKRSLSETDIRTKFITPALRQAGWDEMLQIREEVGFTKGRIIVRGKLVTRGKAKRADYVLYYKPNIPLAIVEAKDAKHSVGDGMKIALTISRIGQARGRPVDLARRRSGSSSAHSASVRSLWQRVVAPLYYLWAVGVHMRISKQASVITWNHLQFGHSTAFRNSFQEMEPLAMHGSSRAWTLVYGTTLFRLLVSVMVASQVTHTYPLLFSFLIFFALLSDLADGWFARSFQIESVLGQVLDLVADKGLTATLLLFAASRGVDLLPLVIIVCRDFLTLGMRSVLIDGKRLLPTSRMFGAIVMSTVGCLTISLLLTDSEQLFLINRIAFWVVAAAVIINTVLRLRFAAPAIAHSAKIKP